MTDTAKIDQAAIGFSLVCVLHCAVLPLFAISMPFIGLVAGAEWVHWLFASLAIITAIAIVIIATSARRLSFVVPAFTGVALLLIALSAETLGFDETLPTVVGGLLLAGAHLFHLFKKHQI